MEWIEKLKDSMLTEDITQWRKKGALIIESMIIIMGPAVLLSVCLKPDENVISNNVFIFSSLIILHSVALMAACLYVYANRVPSYIWHTVMFLVFTSQIWAVFTIALLGAST